ncbi:MAG: hypothetical protein L6420_05250, partial [Elusimicrobia bacterium]|nr:hypothetical protein [Elusimicrobiota bacterium]
VDDPDVEIKGFTIFGSTNVLTHISTAAGNTVFNGAVEVSSDIYIVGKSTFIDNAYFAGAGNIFVNDGSANQMLQKNAAGNLEWIDGSSLGDDLGNHVATTTLDMADFDIVNIGSMTVDNGEGGISIAPYFDPALRYAGDKGISIGSNTYNNYNKGVGVGYNAYGNYSNGVGVGYEANNNNTYGVGVGAYANSNNTYGVGVGFVAYGNYSYGVGVGLDARDNNTYGVGVGAYAQENNDYAVGLGAYSQNNDTYGTGLGAYTTAASSSVALGSYAKANAKESLAIGAGTVNNSTGTASFGVYAIETSSNIVAVGSITANAFFGDGSNLTNVDATDDTKVLKAGDTMTGQLTVSGSTLTIIAPDTVPSSLWVSTSATTPHLYVSTNGNVGIGTDDPGYKLEVKDTGAMSFQVEPLSGYVSLRLNGIEVARMKP